MRAAILSLLVLLGPARNAGSEPAAWTIDPGHSAVHFSVRHMMVSNVRGEFDGPSGTVTFDPASPASIQIDAAIDAKTIDTRNPDRDRDLKSSLFFDVAKFPRITFKSRRAEASSPGHLKITGDLTMHGVTKEVVLDVEGPSPEIKGLTGERRIGATATAAVDRREFGLLYNELIEGGGAVVGNQVTIAIDIELVRK